MCIIGGLHDCYMKYCVGLGFQLAGGGGIRFTACKVHEGYTCHLSQPSPVQPSPKLLCATRTAQLNPAQHMRSLPGSVKVLGLGAKPQFTHMHADGELTLALHPGMRLTSFFFSFGGIIVFITTRE